MSIPTYSNDAVTIVLEGRRVAARLISFDADTATVEVKEARDELVESIVDGDALLTLGIYSATLLECVNGTVRVVYYAANQRQTVDGRAFDSRPTMEAAKEIATSTLNGWYELARVRAAFDVADSTGVTPGARVMVLPVAEVLCAQCGGDESVVDCVYKRKSKLSRIPRSA